MGKHNIVDYRNLIKVSTFAKRYKEGVSTSYVYKLREEGKLSFITIDETHFIDLTTVPEDLKKHLKK